MNSSSSDNYRGITLSVPYPKSSKCVFWIFMAIISLLQICSSVSKGVLVVIMPYMQYSLS